MILVTMETILVGNYVTIGAKLGIILNWLSGAEYRVVTTV